MEIYPDDIFVVYSFFINFNNCKVMETPDIQQKADEIRDKAIENFTKRAGDKYDRGQREHGGLITERVIISDLEDEIIDLWFYLSALKEKIGRLGVEAHIIERRL